MEDNKFQREVLDRLIVLETLIKEQDWKGIKKTSDDAFNMSKENDKRITKIENNQRWLTYLIIGAVVGGILKITLNI